MDSIRYVTVKFVVLPWCPDDWLHQNCIQIRFEDGDYAERVSRKDPNHILTVWEYMRIYETNPPPVKENDEIVTTLSPRQMYASRCKWCELCIKPDCGSCATCMNNSRASSNHGREVCLQKVRYEMTRFCLKFIMSLIDSLTNHGRTFSDVPRDPTLSKEAASLWFAS